MRQPAATKARILKQSGILFNTQGYKATSLSDITDATRLTKGAIYRHFDNKDQLEKEALQFLSDTMFELLKVRIKAETSAPGKLKAIFAFFETYISNPPVKGGCPLLNVSTEVDDANPALRKRALRILNTLHLSVSSILEKGIRYGQLKPGFAVTDYATVIIASLEGALMMSKLHGTNGVILVVKRHLEKMIDEITL